MITQTPTDRLKALADPTRLRLLAVLGEEELTVKELTELLALAQSRVSGHLAVLREAGLVRDRRQGTSAYYSLVREGEAAATWDAVRPTLPPTPEGDRDRQRLETILRARRERSREFFDRNSEAWDGGSETLGTAAGTAALAGLVPDTLTVLDLGTGTGGLLPVLADDTARVIALDSSRGMLRRARGTAGRRDNVRFIRGEVEQLPLPDRSVDGVVMNMVLHHLSSPEQGFREMARVLRPGGRAVVVDLESHDETWLLDEEGHRWAGFDPAQLAAWGVDAGFRVPRISRVPSPDAGRWSRLQVFAARFVRRNPGAERA